MKNKKILPVFGIIAILLTTIGLTYAFFQAQSSAPVTRDVRVLTHTVDMLTFSIDEDISVEATQLNFTNGGDNQDGEATASAILTPNSKTGTATRSYYLYLNIESNPFVYSAANTNHDPELLLQVFDSSDNLVTLTGLGNQVTIDSLTGYDITTARGLKTLLDNHTITASNNATATQEWRVVVTLVNLDVNQNDNTGKTFEAELIIQEDELALGFTGTIYRNNTRVAFNNHTIEDELTSGWCMEDNGTPDCTNPSVTQVVCEYWGDTCSENNVTIGVGTYETNVNTIRTNYNFYLKHEVEDDIIEDTEVCLWYNNHEFCLGPNYWVETGNGGTNHQSDENGVATKNKLQTAMETALGTQADSCYSFSHNARCIFGDFYCRADSDGYVECYGDDNVYCGVYSDGSSGCVLW